MKLLALSYVLLDEHLTSPSLLKKKGGRGGKDFHISDEICKIGINTPNIFFLSKNRTTPKYYFKGKINFKSLMLDFKKL